MDVIITETYLLKIFYVKHPVVPVLIVNVTLCCQRNFINVDINVILLHGNKFRPYYGHPQADQ